METKKNIKSNTILIQISKELWKFLNMKKEIGESFDEVIKKLIKLKGEK